MTILFRRSSGFKTFPDVLVVHMRKFQLVNWVPTKLGKLEFGFLRPHLVALSLGSMARRYPGRRSRSVEFGCVRGLGDEGG